jgi:hypothetical protein
MGAVRALGHNRAGAVRNIAWERDMPPVIVLALGMVGAVALARWCLKEVNRVNADLDSVRAQAPAEPVDPTALPKLKRDPNTGEYRPG